MSWLAENEEMAWPTIEQILHTYIKAALKEFCLIFQNVKYFGSYFFKKKPRKAGPVSGTMCPHATKRSA